ncbi:MAG: hypothetical protein WCA07_02650 [Gloeobacterales cyanobacterium]
MGRAGRNVRALAWLRWHNSWPTAAAEILPRRSCLWGWSGGRSNPHRSLGKRREGDVMSR